MLKIRFKRCGKKQQPTFRLVVMPSRSARDSKALYDLGFYNPITKEVKLDVEIIVQQLKLGVQPTKTVKNLLIKSNIIKK
jgi:small subunit ribosomal protein S16